MDLAAVARRSVYWALDRARGGHVAQAVTEINALLDSSRSPAAVAVRRDRLADLLRHASKVTDYYAGLDPSDLAEFPVVNKLTFRTNGQSMLARGFAARDLYPHRTSGSTGTPFESLWDSGKMRQNQADTIALAGRAGYQLGTPMLYFRLWGGQYRKSRLRCMKEAITPIDVRALDTDRAREVLDGIRRRRRPVTLFGYSSALEQLCHVLDDQDLDVNSHVSAVIAGGEAPTNYLSSAAPRRFGRPLVARYSNSENGLIAQQTPGESAYRINVASYAVEILRHDSDEPTRAGEEGRIVLTDLFNYAMPFIRYDTGDVGTFAVDEDDNVDDTTLAAVSGRALDQLFDTRGRSLNPMAKPELADQNLRQYQLIQTGPGKYTLKLNADRDAGRDARIRADYLTFLGADADLQIEYVDEVPLLASGKRQIVINQWRPTG